MPIGTNITALQLQINKKPTRRPQQKENDFFLELLKSVAIIAASALAAKFTGGISLKLGVKYGLSNFTVQLIASIVKVATEFTINQLYDKHKEQSTLLSTLLNLTPAIGEVSKVSRAYKATKFLKLATKNKVTSYLGIQTANNLEQIISQVQNKTIIVDKYKWFYNYSKKPNKETIMSHLGFLARKEFINSYKTTKVAKLGELLEMETILQKINPDLVAKTKIFEAKMGNQLLKRFGTNIDEISKISTERWLNLISQMQEKGVRSGTLLSLNSLRSDNIFRFQFLNKIQQFSKKIKKLNPRYHINRYLKFEPPKKIITEKYSLKYVDYQLQKGFNKVFYPVKKIREYIKNFELKLQNKIKDYADYKKIFQKVRNKIIKDGVLLPLVSNTFFAVKSKSTGMLNDVAITIYYKNPESGFIGPIITTTTKLEKLLTAQSPFRYYMYESGWSIGWKKTSGNTLPIMKFLPTSVQEFYIGSVKLYTILSPLLKNLINKKDRQKDFFNPKKRVKKFVNDSYIDLGIDSSLGRGFIGKTIKKRIIKPLINGRKINLKPTVKKQINKKITQKITKISKNLHRKW